MVARPSSKQIRMVLSISARTRPIRSFERETPLTLSAGAVEQLDYGAHIVSLRELRNSLSDHDIADGEASVPEHNFAVEKNTDLRQWPRFQEISVPEHPRVRVSL